jgi:hypothetical protein
MKIKERLYPHPVQSFFSDDLVGCNFQVTPVIKANRNFYSIEVSARTSSSDLHSMISEKKATYAVHIECAATRYRHLIKFSETSHVEEIPADFLDGNVELCSFVIADCDIEKYTNSNFHDDYYGVEFYIKKGDVLAVSHDAQFDAEKDIDPLEKITSIIKVRENRLQDAPPIDVDINDEFIVIKLSEKNYQSFAELRKNNNLQTTLSSMIVVPALIYCLDQVKTAAETDDHWYEHKKWFKVLARRLKKMGFKDMKEWKEESSIVLSGRIIDDPLTDSLKMLVESEDGAED